MHDIDQDYKVFSLLKPQVATSTVTGTGVDVGPEQLDDAMAILDIGAVSGTSPTLDVTIQASGTSGGTYTTIATFGQVTAATKLGVVSVSLEGLAGVVDRRFVRAVATIAGTTPSFALGCVLAVRAARGGSSLNSSTPA